MRLKVRTTFPIAICASRQANGAPGQTCGPSANARWRFSRRPMCRSSGLANCAGSRLAAPMTGVRKSPAATRHPQSRTPRSHGGRSSALANRNAKTPPRQSRYVPAQPAGAPAAAHAPTARASRCREVRRRLVSGKQEPHTHADQFIVLQDPATVLRLDQRGQEATDIISRQITGMR